MLVCFKWPIASLKLLRKGCSLRALHKSQLAEGTFKSSFFGSTWLNFLEARKPVQMNPPNKTNPLQLCRAPRVPGPAMRALNATSSFSPLSRAAPAPGAPRSARAPPDDSLGSYFGAILGGGVELHAQYSRCLRSGFVGIECHP